MSRADRPADGRDLTGRRDLLTRVAHLVPLTLSTLTALAQPRADAPSPADADAGVAAADRDPAAADQDVAVPARHTRGHPSGTLLTRRGTCLAEGRDLRSSPGK